jgi:GNAT superfamily N-acetyltransferase
MQQSTAVIRPAWGADLSGLARIDPTLSTDQGRTTARILGLGRSWVAEIDQRPAGYALTSLAFFGRPLVERLFVVEPHRRRGIGLQLLDRCESAHQDDRLFVTVKASNAAGTGLLNRGGFQGSGVIYNLDPADPDLVYVRLRAPPMTFVRYQAQG